MLVAAPVAVLRLHLHIVKVDFSLADARRMARLVDLGHYGRLGLVVGALGLLDDILGLFLLLLAAHVVGCVRVLADVFGALSQILRVVVQLRAFLYLPRRLDHFSSLLLHRRRRVVLLVPRRALSL